MLNPQEQLGKVMGMLSHNDGALTREDLNNYIWVRFQRSLAHKVKPNWWEVCVNPADTEALGGAHKVAEACWQMVRQEWVEEGRAAEGETPDVVFCRVDTSISRGRAKVQAEELDIRTLVRKQLTAQAAGKPVCAGAPKKAPVVAQFAISCPWNGARIPVTGDLSFGRSPANDVVLQDQPYVSHSHGQLVRDGAAPSGWSYLDLGSRNGSSVNGAPVSEKTPLAEGDRIGLGGSCYVVFERI